MCSFGARLLQGEASSSSICSTTTMDSSNIITTTNKGVLQSVGSSSLATALRDRQAYVIPIQPNRSLPVRPAPHHTPCRTTIVRSRSFSRPTSYVITTLQPSVIEAPQSRDIAAGSPETATKKSEEKQEDETSKKSGKFEESKKSVNSKEENDDRDEESSVTKSGEGTEETTSEMKRNYTGDRNTSGTSGNSRLIDISHSPERIDLESDEVTIYPTNEGTSGRCWSNDPNVRDTKRKRRRKSFKRTIDDMRDDYISCITDTGSRTVPPLRLKKIQTLQEPVATCGSSWQGIGREIDESTFTINAGSITTANGGNIGSDKRLKNAESHGDLGGKEYSSKYRIVTGHTPPYEDCIDSSSPSIESRIDSLDAAKLRYRQTKLKVKLRELRRKTVDLGKQMLRTVLTTSSAPRGSRLRQTMTGYEEQIENLEKLLNVLPKATGYADDVVDTDWPNYADTTKVIDEPEVERNFVISPARTRSSSTSSSMCSSPSLEPPKLSPRSPTNYAAARSPSEVRNSPPVLPRVYVTITDCCEYSWEGRNNSSRRGRVKRRYRSPEKKEILRDSSQQRQQQVMSTTTEAIVDDEKREIVDDTWENLDSNEKTFGEIDKKDSNTNYGCSVDVMEIYEDTKTTANETKDCPERSDETKHCVKVSTSPRPKSIIDTTSVDTDFDAKPCFVEDIGQLPIDDVAASSTCEIVRDNKVSIATERKEDDIKEVVTVRDEIVEEQQNGNGLSIDEQFPTFGNWIAGLSKKQVDANDTCAKLKDTAVVEDRSSVYPQQVFNPEADKPATPEVLQSSASTVVHENIVTPQWRNDRWPEQQDEQQPLAQTYAPALPLPPPSHATQIGQEFCSPIAMARLYTRNYAIDPYGVAYGCNPATIAAAATASFWNSAAILQYPLMRNNAAILNSQQTRVQSSNVQFPTGTVSQRPSYRGIQQTPGTKRTGIDSSIVNYGQRDAKLMSGGTSTSYDRSKRLNLEFQPNVAAEQGRISCNNVNGQTTDYRACFQQQYQQQLQQQQPHHQLPQQQQQSQERQQFARAAYADSSQRLAVPATWRSSNVIGPMGVGYNYSGTSGWATNPGNTLNSLSRTSTPNFATPSTPMSINSSRARIVKDRIDGNLRNCETPHLGKVAYSPNTVSNLECSNCGLAGSMFKCLGCEVAFYCDENCQTRHWNRHVISCPKKMPKLKKLVH